MLKIEEDQDGGVCVSLSLSLSLHTPLIFSSETSRYIAAIPSVCLSWCVSCAGEVETRLHREQLY